MQHNYLEMTLVEAQTDWIRNWQDFWKWKLSGELLVAGVGHWLCPVGGAAGSLRLDISCGTYLQASLSVTAVSPAGLPRHPFLFISVSILISYAVSS